jgi:hypothetical protein
MNVEMIEPTPAPQPTQGVFMDKFQAPNLIGIIMQALEQHIEAIVDKRFTERMAEIQIEMPNLDDIKNSITEMIDEKMEEHKSMYDHEEYDETVRIVDDAELDDIEAKIKDTLRGMTISLDI